MGIRREELEAVKKVLESSHRGMTITEVTEKLQINRNSVAKYLEMLLMAGKVEMKSFGRSKIYRLSRRVPLATALSLSSDLIVFIDEGLEVVDVNDQFLKFAGLERSQLIGQSISDLTLDILVHRDILLNLKDALRGTEYIREISVRRGDAEHYFLVKLIPVAITDVQCQIAAVYENITARKKAELALKASEARYRAVVEDQTELICRILPDSTITFTNGAWCKLFRRKREDVLGKKLTALIPFEYHDLLFSYLRNDKECKNMKPFVHRVAYPSGEGQWLHWTCRCIADDRGKTIEFQLVGRDITDQKKTEESLRIAQFSMDGATDTINWVDKSGRFIYVNDAMCKKLGYSREELLTMAVWDVDPLFPREIWAGHWEQVKAEKHVKVESIHRARDGTQIPVEVTINYLCLGPIEYHCTYVRDITQQKQAQAAQQESLSFLQTLINTIPVPVFYKDAGGRYLGCNAAFEKFAHRPKDQILGSTAFDLVRRETAVEFTRHDKQVLKCGQPGIFEGSVVLADGTRRTVVQHRAPFYDAGGRVGGTIVVIFDISDRKKE